MAAANTDKARKSYSFLQKTLNGSISDVATTLTPNNVTNIPTDTGVTMIIDRVDSAGNATPTLREIVTGVVSGGTIANLVRGQHGTTAQSHASGAVVEFVFAGNMWNDLIDHLLTHTDQSGNIDADNTATFQSNIDINDSSTAIRDSSDNELLKFAKTASAVNELTVTNAATGNAPVLSATGGDSNINASVQPKGTGEVLLGGTYARLGAVKTYTYDGTNIFLDGVSLANGANTTNWSKPANLKFVEVEVQAGGGGGSGAAASTAGNWSGAMGGGGGGYSRKKIAAASLGSTETITVGAKGAGGSAGANDGTAGGSSSFGAHATATGGGGGTGRLANASTAAAFSGGGAGGAGASGDVNVTGAPTQTGMRISGFWGISGQGGSSVFSGGARNVNDAAGVAAAGYGGGGSGAGVANGTGAAAGGNGSAGIVIVREYY